MSPKAMPAFARPVPTISPAALAKLEERSEAAGNAVAGQQPAVLASLQARVLAGSQAHNAAELQAREAAALQPPSAAEPGAAESQARKLASSQAPSRSGTQAAPHVRADGQATRSTTLHLPVDLHQELRMAAARQGVHMSAIVAEAVRAWLSQHK